MLDDAAFRAFASTQVERIQGWARALNVTTQDAEDITQEALLCLWQNREAIEQSRWPAWLWTAMVLRGREHFRSRRRAEEREEAFAATMHQELLSASPEVEMQFREDETELLRLIDLLRPERREVVRLYLLEELPMKEVAEHLGISVNTAQKRWVLAQADMRAAFERERAKERFRLVLAAIAAFFAALWSRIAGRGTRRSGPILACATLLLVASDRGEPAEALASDATALLLPSPSFEYTFTPRLTAFAERELEAASRGGEEQALEAPRTLLAQAAAALQEGHPAIARTCLAQYRAAYPVDPTGRFARQYATLVAALSSSH